MIEHHPITWEMTDEELIEELGRNGWDWDNGRTPMEQEIAIIQEALRRILQHVTDEKIGVNQFMCAGCEGIFSNGVKHRVDGMDFCSEGCHKKRCEDECLQA
jgi:hypothetical protein